MCSSQSVGEKVATRPGNSSTLDMVHQKLYRNLRSPHVRMSRTRTHSLRSLGACAVEAKSTKRNVDTRGSLCTISTTFHRSTDASTHLNPGPFTEHGSFDRKMRSENHTPRPCAPDQLCVVNMDQNLCLLGYNQIKSFLEGSISSSLPRFTGLIRLSACMDDHCHLCDDPRNTTTLDIRANERCVLHMTIPQTKVGGIV